MNFELLINNQHSFFNTNKTKDIGFRTEQLKKLKKIIKQNETLLYQAIYKDFKKSEFDTYTCELLILYSDINTALNNIDAWSTRKDVKTNFFNFPASSYILPEPLGTSLIIGAWNYPYQLSLGPAIAAIAAGNTVILKPSEVALNTSKAIAEIINANFSPEYFIVIEGGVVETTELLKLKFDKIFFTGSTSTGKIVYEAAAKHLTPVTLELGGKSPAFITKDCNLKASVKRLVWGKFLNAGQTCIAPDYVLVDADIEEKFIAALKECIIKSDYSLANNNYVQIINDKHFNRLVNLIDNKKVCFGGKYNSVERYIEPTILTSVSFEDEIMKEEIFGPLLPVISYTNIDEVIAAVKKKHKPLSCYVFTNDKAIKDKILSEISFGGGCINDSLMHIANDNLPFGGVGNSGTGSYHGEAGFKTFSHYKSILEKPFWFEPNFKYPPYSKRKLNLIKRLKSLM